MFEDEMTKFAKQQADLHDKIVFDLLRDHGIERGPGEIISAFARRIDEAGYYIKKEVTGDTFDRVYTYTLYKRVGVPRIITVKGRVGGDDV